MSNLAPQNDVLNLTPSKTSTTSSSFSKTSKNKENETKNSTHSNQDDTENFLNSLLKSIDETNEFLPDRMKISHKEVINEAMNKLQKGMFDESDKISIFESASFMQILSLLDKLKTDTKDIKLGNLSSQLAQFVKTEANFNALKSASNLSELLNIAKDLGLNVKNIKIDRLLDLKTTFPNLDKADFFKGAVDNVFKEIINNKIANINKNLNHHLQNATHSTLPNHQKANSKSSDSLLSQTLKNLDSMLLSKDDKKDDKYEKKDKTKAKLKIEEDVSDTKNTFKNIKNDELLKEVENNNLNAKEKKNQDNPIKENLDKFSNKDTLKDKENKELFKEIEKEQNKNFKNENSPVLKDVHFAKDNKTNTKDSIKDIKQNILDQKVSFENLNKTQVVQNKDDSANFNQNYKENFTQDQPKIHSEIPDKNNLDELNSLVKDLNKVSQNNTRNINPKETLQYFSQDLKEAVEQYKAPITKLSITLNPNNLGEVEVTLVQRGSNLHINFNSNTNAMNLFIQNQAEFKNSLVNMGFTGLEMNFSDQGKKEQNQNQGKNRSGYGFKDALDEKNEGEKINLELILAKYF